MFNRNYISGGEESKITVTWKSLWCANSGRLQQKQEHRLKQRVTSAMLHTQLLY